MTSKTYSIVGMNFVKSEPIIAALKDGAELTLIREPSNPFDPLAVAIYDAEGRKLGFIPKKQNTVLAQFIDQAGTDLPVPDLALDSAIGLQKAVPGKFVRSPNSGYPQVIVSE
jgi:hypothetical protein